MKKIMIVALVATFGCATAQPKSFAAPTPAATASAADESAADKADTAAPADKAEADSADKAEAAAMIAAIKRQAEMLRPYVAAGRTATGDCLVEAGRTHMKAARHLDACLEAVGEEYLAIARVLLPTAIAGLRELMASGLAAPDADITASVLLGGQVGTAAWAVAGELHPAIVGYDRVSAAPNPAALEAERDRIKKAVELERRALVLMLAFARRQ